MYAEKTNRKGIMILQNIYSSITWEQALTSNPLQSYNIQEYHEILCPPSDYPPFLDRYIQLPMLQRLKGIGLLCGSDWTKLFHNRLYYSRLDHSVGVALIIWHFTHDKAQTIAGLLHDVSTPVFSHVSDFRKGDALTQTVTEESNASLVRSDAQLLELLAEDGLTVDQVEDYHKYPVADNEIPQLSSDRLEYMYPSGMALEGSWSMEEIRRTYNDIAVLTNEEGLSELGFKTVEIAEEYCKKFCMTGHLLQMNEDKLSLHMLGQIMNMAVEEGLLQEEDFMQLSESEIMAKVTGQGSPKFQRLFRTFREMTKIVHSEVALNEDQWFCVNLKVKQRFINPLVLGKRLYDISAIGKKIIDDFMEYQDTAFGCVKLI